MMQDDDTDKHNYDDDFALNITVQLSDNDDDNRKRAEVKEMPQAMTAGE